MLENIARLQSPSLEDITARANIQAEAANTFHVEAEQTVELDANIVAVAFSGNEACFDFYEASPFSVSAVTATNTLGLIPVVRVNTRTSLALGMIARLRDLVKQFHPVQAMGDER
jgi:hypothetical protein